MAFNTYIYTWIKIFIGLKSFLKIKYTNKINLHPVEQGHDPSVIGIETLLLLVPQDEQENSLFALHS